MGRTILPITLLLLLTGLACRSVSNNDNASAGDIVVINAPATGEVTRILAAEGVHVNQGSPVIEIAVRNTIAETARDPRATAEAQAVRNYQAADVEIESARAAAVRHGAEVDRLTPLVASGAASQGQLDGERALSDAAHRRLQQAQDAKRKAEGGLIAARQPGFDRVNPGQPESPKQFVPAVAPSAGIVSVVNVRPGEQVKQGQPLATIRANE